MKTDTVSDVQSTADTPLWVKVFGAIALVIVVLFLVALLTGRGGHGPARHGYQALPPSATEPGGAGDDTPPPVVARDEQRP